MTQRLQSIQWIVLTLLLLLHSTHSYSQQPYYKKYTIANGLPGNTVYSITQDKQHFLWLSTENGVCRFDGRNVKAFTRANSNFDLGVFSLYNDMRNRVWAISIFSAPVYYYNNCFYSLPKPVQKATHYTRWMLEDGRGYLYFLTHNGTIVRWKEGSQYEILNISNIALTGGAVINDTMLVVTGVNKTFSVSNFKTIKQLDITGYQHEPNRLFKLKNNIAIGYASNGIYQFTPNGSKLLMAHADPFTSISYSMHVENDSTIWLATRNGVHIYKYKNEQLIPEKKLLEGKIILAIYKDHNNNYWFSSANDGIYFLNATANRYYTVGSDKANIGDIIFTGNTGHIFNHNGAYNQLKDDSIIKKNNFTASDPTLTYIRSLKLSDSSILLLFRGGVIGTISNGKLKMNVSEPFMPAHNYYYRSDGKFFSILTLPEQTEVKQIAGDSSIPTLYIKGDIKTDVTKHFCFDYLKRCWFSAADTLVCVQSTGIDNFSIYKLPMHGIFIADICCDKANNVWVATRGAGIYCIGNNNTLTVYNTGNGLSSNFCSRLYVDNAENIWACTLNGLSKIYHSKNDGFHIKAYTKENLLPITDVYCMYKKGDWVYAGATDGIFAFKDVNDTLSSDPVNCYITGVAINGKPVNIKDNYTLKYSQPISIDFSTIGFSQSSEPVYRYKLEGADERWNTTMAEQIQYAQLKPGKYTFKVYSGTWPSKTVSVQLYIESPYWLQWWFILCEVLAFIGIAFIASYIVVRAKHRKAELARRMLENDLKSLRAQINPHFIFNALNSIQDFILDQQPRIANHYLTRFARLMRMIVDNSAKEWINLGSEIYFLQLYLDLEKLRLGNSFSFSIITDADIDTELLHIPPMLIQPLAENCIKHGLAGKEGAKQLEIHFSMQKEMVYCRIKDNGLGRTHARAVAAKNMSHNSMGIDNIRERLHLLTENKNTITEHVIITDLYDGNTPAGTLVEIWIPFFIDN